MVQLADLRSRDYESMPYFARLDASMLDFAGLLDFLVEYAGLSREDLGKDFWIYYNAGMLCDSFIEVAEVILERGISIPDWWPEQVQQIPLFQAQYDAEEVLGIVEQLPAVSDLSLPWDSPEEAAC
ncbi:hypothetical protein C1Y63_07935 [Corynebacterium sp. 13CS0277]|uniref:hypothetical protein n=1 Tax=Corynebacterium sp. 13CS0277 TaxID=2071994 RepID=UPI000D032045|nr:hypothetical protein [Corynebacterium sp. 13CS0277]PRQ11171.1 hypothetical protein C1Y63_07935 [Corynebacterium sp. 13CS0277]